MAKTEKPQMQRMRFFYLIYKKYATVSRISSENLSPELVALCFSDEDGEGG
jgi:hypothetical protein